MFMVNNSLSRICEVTNNPLNIRFVASNNWRGQVGYYKGFAKFSDTYFGLRAAIILLRRYIKQGYNTPAKIITRWAPPSENDTNRYIAYVCYFVGVTPDTVIKYKSYDFWKLVIRMARFETCYRLDNNTISVVLKLFREL